ncbi:XapX domain protein [Chroogloeocystis siderophila 5.2 s.c.1]|jgi:XapX domain-containing protein|uniref:XapX domain protein n=2 Tax=Chroogloeocystis TaxID=329162 RepID=A0A1U7HUA8_9CHRO|nr:XapX domain protein [Chroogloeocystis siderophila 5.2 s.c.1]
MSVFRDISMALLGGWVIGIVFGWLKLPAPVPPLIGLIGATGILIGGYCYSLLVRLFTSS